MPRRLPAHLRGARARLEGRPRRAFAHTEHRGGVLWRWPLSRCGLLRRRSTAALMQSSATSSANARWDSLGT